MDKYEIHSLQKILIIGDSGAGKTCLLLKFAEDSFTTSHISTVGIDFKIKTINVDGKNIKLQIWDTAGQDRFRTITQTYYKGAMGIILAYDCTDESSFNNIRHWLGQIEQHAIPEVVKVVIGTKSDMPNKVIDAARGKELADEYGLSFFETSAKTGKNVNKVFTSIAKEINDRELVELKPGMKIKKDSDNVEGSGCCGFLRK